MAIYNVWLADAESNLIAPLRPLQIDYVVTLSDVGWLRLILPQGERFEADDIRVDRRLIVTRRAAGEATRVRFLAFARRWSTLTNGDGFESLMLAGVDANELAARRIVAYAAGSAESDKTGAAGDLMLEVFDENFISATDTDRNVGALAGGVVLDAAVPGGPAVDKAFAWQNVLSTLHSLQAMSKQLGQEMFWSIEPTGLDRLFLTVYDGAPGRDRSITSSAPLVFGAQFGNVLNVRLVDDYVDEATVVYAGGQGQGAARLVEEMADADRVAASIWNRREAFVNASNLSTSAALQDAASAYLEERRPIVRVFADIISTPATPFGTRAGWNLGDTVTVVQQGRTFTATVRSVTVSVDQDGKETVVGQLAND